MTEEDIDPEIDYSVLKGNLTQRQAVEIAGKQGPCHRLVRDIRKQAEHALDEGAEPHEIIGVLRLEAMRMEKMLIDNLSENRAILERIQEEYSQSEE